MTRSSWPRAWASAGFRAAGRWVHVPTISCRQFRRFAEAPHPIELFAQALVLRDELGEACPVGLDQFRLGILHETLVAQLAAQLADVGVILSDDLGEPVDLGRGIDEPRQRHQQRGAHHHGAGRDGLGIAGIENLQALEAGQAM